MYNNKNSGRDSGMSGESYNSSPDSTNSPDKVIADLDLIVEKWIQYMWSFAKSKQDSKLEFDDLEMIVNWSRVDINQEEAKFDQTMKGHMPKSQTLFRTYFTNKTDTEQEYSFKTERVTRQCCTFSFLKGFTREKEGGLTIKFPQEIVELGGGMRSEQTVECGKDQTKEEEISWGVDSVIRVPPRTRTIANLVITEMNMERDFQVDTKIKGRLTVKVLNRKDNNSFVKSFSGDIYDIVNDAISKNWFVLFSPKLNTISLNPAINQPFSHL